MHKDFTSKKAVRAIAVYEAVKGAIVLGAGVGLLTMIHKDLAELAEDIVFGLNLNPENHYPQLFIETLGKLDATKIKFIFAFAVVYAAVRFAEAYGLWRMRAWAEWFAIVSGAIYLPVEIYEIFKKPTAFRFSIFTLNLAIVLYLIYIRREARYQKTHAGDL